MFIDFLKIIRTRENSTFLRHEQNQATKNATEETALSQKQENPPHLLAVSLHKSYTVQQNSVNLASELESSSGNRSKAIIGEQHNIHYACITISSTARDIFPAFIYK